MPIPSRSDFNASELRALARKSKDAPQARRPARACGDLRGCLPHRGGADRRRDAADRARLGGQVQRSREFGTNYISF